MADELRVALRELTREGMTAEEAAEAVLDRPDLREIVLPVLVAEARHIIRFDTRRAEAELRLAWQQERSAGAMLVTRSRVRPPSQTTPSGSSVVSQPNHPATPRVVSPYQALAGRAFWLPDGTYVNWLEATPEQHRARAGWLRQDVQHVVAKAELHEEAARRIEAAGVRCLADLEVAA